MENAFSICCNADGPNPIPKNIGASHPAFLAAGRNGNVAQKRVTTVVRTQAAPNKYELILKIAETIGKAVV